ncbi:HXXEE domain-containing protein [Rhizorhabdus dicambivorans]|uniref:HXXEE domain-containing protein n=1 Tax=Rhizorhabdus dicambivorans TaxID=1850238 RepID=A0A2A4FT79_9SPHN|nr:HXXEE domain-containing protein [Rhizorhabdus dicambivorans]ATE64327.1 HXXEE domain-containing protein [Rhizorhabdus dicambivorans]PCE40906.1 HXXEE domain-containing protein [Rhizorhabdus dicambivorans]
MTISFYRLIWLLPVAFALHLVEEYCTGYPAYAAAVTGHPMALPMFLGPNILFVAIMALLTWWAAKTRKPAAMFWLLAWAAGNQFWNFVYHLIAVPAHDRHSPGLITGALIYLPLSLAIWQAALAERQIGCKALAGAIAIGGAFMALVAAVGIYHVGGV